MNFWKWFLKGASEFGQEKQLQRSKPGIYSYFDIWLICHFAIGAILMFIVPLRINIAATSILLPLAGIFIGLTFAWGGNAVSLMQSDEMNKIADHLPGGLQVYAFKFQSAILILLITMVAWGLAGLGIFESLYSSNDINILYSVIKLILYFLISLALRDCWHVVMGAQSMILLRRSVKKTLEQQNKK
jgi:hypothetical protein